MFVLVLYEAIGALTCIPKMNSGMRRAEGINADQSGGVGYDDDDDDDDGTDDDCKEIGKCSVRYICAPHTNDI